MTRRLTLLERLEHKADQTVQEIVRIDERLGELDPILSELEKLQAERERLLARRAKIEPVALSTSALIVAMTAANGDTSTS